MYERIRMCECFIFILGHRHIYWIYTCNKQLMNQHRVSCVRPRDNGAQRDLPTT